MFEQLLSVITRRLVPVLMGLFVLRAAFLFINGLDLIGDESYYWDWSRRPDWCYYSKPPMVAWLIGIAASLGGHETAVVRLPAVVLGTAFLGYLYATARAMYSAQAAALAVLLVLATPANVLANFIMTIDPPLYCFWMAALYHLHQSVFERKFWHWLWAGIATGLALLSKQSALLLPVLLMGFLLSDRQQRVLLRREYWFFLLPVLLSLLPILIWNMQHDWVMLGHSKGHFGGGNTATLAKRLGDAGLFLLYQLLLASPVLFVLMLATAYRGCKQFRQWSPQQRFLFWMGPAPLAAILLLSLLQKTQGNWPIPFYFSSVILLAGQWQAGSWKKILPLGAAVGLVMVALTYALPVTIQAFNLHNTVIDPTFRFRHWRELAASIESQRRLALPDSRQAFVLTYGHRFLASQLAFYLPDHPDVYRYEASGRVISQYEVWGWPESLKGKTAFIVSEKDDAKLPDALKSAFRSVDRLGEIDNPMQKNQHYYLFRGNELLVIPTVSAD